MRRHYDKARSALPPPDYQTRDSWLNAFRNILYILSITVSLWLLGGLSLCRLPETSSLQVHLSVARSLLRQIKPSSSENTVREGLVRDWFLSD